MKLLRRKKLWILALLVLLLAGGYGLIRQQRARLRLEQAQALAQQAFSQETRKLSEQQRQALREQMRRAMSQLDRGQRSQLFQARRQQRTAELKQLFKLPRRQQTARLDQEIRQAEQRRQQMQQARTAGGGNARGGTGANPPGANTARPRSTDPAQREARAKQRLDNTTPEERAVWSQYRQLVNQRRSELGLPSLTGRGGR